MDASTAIWIGINNIEFIKRWVFFLYAWVLDNGNPLNVGSLYSASLLDASTKTQPVEPVIYRHELKRGEKSFQYLRTPKFDSDWLYRKLFIS